MKPGSAWLVMAILLASAAPLAAAVVQEMELSGAAEVPPNASPAIGVASITHDPDAHTLRVVVEFSGLLGTTTTAHIHCCADATANAPVASPTPTFPGFPAGVTAGSYDVTLDLAQSASYSATFLNNNGGTVEAAEAVLADAFAHGNAYVNIHTTVFAGGEIRGQVPPIIPIFRDGFEAAPPGR